MAEGAEDRTEAATPARLLRAKNDGNAPVAREVLVFAGLTAGCFALLVSTASQARLLLTAMGQLLATAGESMQSGIAVQCLWALIFAGLHVVVPVAAASAAAIIGAHLLQIGFVPKFSMPSLDLSRISPMAGLTRLFGAESAIAGLKSTVKVLVIGGVVSSLILSRRDEFMSSLLVDPDRIPDTIVRMVFVVVAAALGVQGLIAMADFAWTRFHFMNSMKMSQTEVKDETKDADGNPHVKARMRRLIASRSKQSLKAAMSRATVVITNPTHYAVALDYKQGQTQAPKIVAKGSGDLAARIREYAGDARVPIVSNPPLARALFKLELESEVPEEHYKAVAEIIAYVWRLAGRTAQNQRSRPPL